MYKKLNKKIINRKFSSQIVTRYIKIIILKGVRTVRTLKLAFRPLNYLIGLDLAAILADDAPEIYKCDFRRSIRYNKLAVGAWLSRLHKRPNN